MPLNTTHKAESMADILENKAIKESISTCLARKKDIPHVFLLTGPAGCGKSTIARILAKELNCSDLITYNSSNSRGIDTIREIEKNIQLAPILGGNKMYILEEVHGLTKDAKEAPLVLLERVPKHAFFCMTTTEPSKLTDAFRRRCHEYKVSPISDLGMEKFLKDTCDKEGVDDFPEELINKIVKEAKGSVGIALNYLDKVIDVLDIDEAISVLESTTVSDKEAIDLCRVLIGQEKGATKWIKAKKILSNIKGEPESIRYVILGYLSAVMLNKGGEAEAFIMSCFVESFVNSGKAGLIFATYTACKEYV